VVLESAEILRIALDGQSVTAEHGFTRRRLIAEVRELVDGSSSTPSRSARDRVDLQIHGRLAALLRISAGERDEASFVGKWLRGQDLNL
jgi:hypothetical protein